MAKPYVLTALVAKRAEIAGQIEHVQTTLRQLIIDLGNLDATIRIFCYVFRPMLSRNRLHKLALRGWLITVILSAIAYPLLAQETQGPSKTETQAEESEPLKARPEIAAPTAPAEDKQPRAKSKHDSTNGPDYYSEADLAAQERMAFSTEDLVRLTKRQNTITAIESVLLAITIFFTALAAFAASRAAGAADRAVEVTSKTARHQLRAYLLVDDVTGVEKSSGPNIEVVFRNSGQTPAQSVRGLMGFVYGEGGEQRFNIDGTSLKAARDVGPNQDLKIIKHIATAKLPYRGLENVESGGAPFFVHGRMIYEDVFGKEHSTVFRFKYHARNKAFYVADNGNCSD